MCVTEGYALFSPPSKLLAHEAFAQLEDDCKFSGKVNASLLLQKVPKSMLLRRKSRWRPPSSGHMMQILKPRDATHLVYVSMQV